MREDESLKTFGEYGSKSAWAIVIKAVHCIFRWDWDEGG